MGTVINPLQNSALSIDGPSTSKHNADMTTAVEPEQGPFLQQLLAAEESPSEDGVRSSEDSATTYDTAISSSPPLSRTPRGGPSATTPLFWMLQHGQDHSSGPSNQLLQPQHLQRHRRSASSASTDTFAEPGAITIQDNDGDDRNRMCWARSVQITDYVVVNGSTSGIGAFVVWNIRVETLNGSHINIRKRYSEFDEFRRRLILSFPNFEAAVPELPPKSVISKFRPRFLEKRRAGLQYFLK